jgi:hypothetical protein
LLSFKGPTVDPRPKNPTEVEKYVEYAKKVIKNEDVSLPRLDDAFLK